MPVSPLCSVAGIVPQSVTQYGTFVIFMISLSLPARKPGLSSNIDNGGNIIEWRLSWTVFSSIFPRKIATGKDRL
jgi:hypothetical protein